jgi:hypothetical protein
LGAWASNEVVHSIEQRPIRGHGPASVAAGAEGRSARPKAAPTQVKMCETAPDYRRMSEAAMQCGGRATTMVD